MLTKTTRSAIRLLTYLGQSEMSEPLSPRYLAGLLAESPSYLAKVTQHLVRAGILQSHRGVTGGVVLNRPPDAISMLAIVEACQGAVLGEFCEDAPDLSKTCAYHQACAELHQATVGIMSRWTLAQFVQRPRPVGMTGKKVVCWLEPNPQLVELKGSRQTVARSSAMSKSVERVTPGRSAPRSKATRKKEKGNKATGRK